MNAARRDAWVRGVVLAGVVSVALAAGAQAVELNPTPKFAMPTGALTLHEPAVANRPFTVTGERGAILGMQDGTAELWELPVKFFSGLRLRAEVEGYSEPIDLNAAAADIDVSPDHTTITYANAALTVRQHMFVPAGEGNEGLGGVIVFEVESIRPAVITVSLTPSMERMWPAPQFGAPSWGFNKLGTGGAYVIGTDNPGVFGMIGMAHAMVGPISPEAERPHVLPLEFRVTYDPKTDRGMVFPLLCEASREGEKNDAAGVAAVQKRLIAKAEALPEIYKRTQAYYARFFDERLVVHTPDKRFDEAMAWAELAIDKAQVTTPRGETGLVAGWFPSFASARPGYGWFFGRDSLWSVYAIDSYGDAALVRRAIDFLVKRQRADGKMMHEYSQSADELTGDLAWKNFPYEYAAADSTPLYLLAMQDYVRTTGDVEYLRKHWESVKLAYSFERAHGTDGVYDNTQGTGWVEGWPPKMPHQELYLAALDRDATRAMAEMAGLMKEDALAAEAGATAKKIAAAVEAYHRPDGTYAFSRNADGSYDPTMTVYPSVAMWWSGEGFGKPGTMLTDWASHGFATDWGTRAVEKGDPLFNPISYHQGTVWPLFTGWTAMAEYNGGRPLAGYAALERNVMLTWAQDPGAVTELLSGEFYQPLGRSSTHQLWSSAMVLAPAMRGMFGLKANALEHTLTVAPHLPAGWDRATLEHVRVGEGMFDVTMTKKGAALEVVARGKQAAVLCLARELKGECKEAAALEHRMTVPLPEVEVEPVEGAPLEFGEMTHQARVVDEEYGAREARLKVEARAGAAVELRVRKNRAGAVVKVEGGELAADVVKVAMPAGEGWVQREVVVRW